MEGPLLLGVSLLVGLLAGALHAWLLRRAVERAVARRSAAALLLTAPLRVLLPALAVLAPAPLGLTAVAGSLVGIVVAGQLARWLAVRAAPAPARTT